MDGLLPDISIRDLGGLAVAAAFMGGIIGFIVRSWLRQSLSGVFVEHADLARVQSSVDGVKADVAVVKQEIQRVTERQGELEEQVQALPTKEDVKQVRHDVKELLQQNAALGATVAGHGELLEGMDRRQEIILKTLLENRA